MRTPEDGVGGSLPSVEAEQCWVRPGEGGTGECRARESRVLRVYGGYSARTVGELSKNGRIQYEVNFLLSLEWREVILIGSTLYMFYIRNLYSPNL